MLVLMSQTSAEVNAIIPGHKGDFLKFSRQFDGRCAVGSNS